HYSLSLDAGNLYKKEITLTLPVVGLAKQHELAIVAAVVADWLPKNT
uniref:Uncharacterized protein n=1 Tax=Ciona intestinalis TaxID=7719 RepID=H2XVG5_CIOIN